MNDYKEAILVGLLLTLPLTLPLVLLGCGVNWCFALALGIAITGVHYILIFKDKNNEHTSKNT